MKCFWSYVKYNLKRFLLFIGYGVVMTAVMLLNDIPAAEVRYGVFVGVFLFLMVAAWEYYGYWKKYDRLMKLEKSAAVSIEGMEKTNDLIENGYQRCLERIFEEKTAKETEYIGRERDMMEYFTMWVHQVKTPIAALRLLLQENHGETEIAAGRFEEMQELFRIEQYVEMALQYMRLGSESTDFVLKKVELDLVIREAVHKYARQFISKKIALDYKAVNRTVVTDEKWLEFVVEQLLSNALKYTQKGKISIRLDERENMPCLVIEDTGIGIRAEDLPRVCEKGYTGYNGHEDKRSTGIGLYLCSSILRKLNHTFAITSEEGKGTRVAIGFGTEE